jgi:acyl-CoA synthetase (NDP forming)
VDIWAAATFRGVELGYREGLEAALRDPNIDTAIPILRLTKEIGVPSFDCLLDLRAKYPEKPIIVTCSGDRDCMEQCKAYLEARGMPTFFEIEYPFIALSILACRVRAMARSARDAITNDHIQMTTCESGT